MKIKKYLLAEIWCANKKKNKHDIRDLMLQCVLNKCNKQINDLSHEQIEELDIKLYSVIKFCVNTYEKSTRHVSKVVLQCAEDFVDFTLISHHPDDTAGQSTPTTTTPTTASADSKSKIRGRPTTPFEELNPSGQYKRAKKLTSQYSKDELCFSTQQKLRENSDQSEAATLLKLSQTTPTKPRKILHAYRTQQSKASMQSYKPYEALALMIRNRLSVRMYNDIKQSADDIGHYLYPSYHDVLSAKKECYPNDITATDAGADINFCSLIHHTFP